MMSTVDRVARVWLQWSVSLVPPQRRTWARAMAAEFEAVPSGRERASFAFGCLLFAVTSWAQSRRGMVWIGRGLIAAGLWTMSAVGAFVAAGLDGIPSLTLFAACAIYTIGGAIALFSLRALWGYAILGVVSAACLFWANANAASSLTFHEAIALEAVALMIGLIAASTILMRLTDHNTRAGDA